MKFYHGTSKKWWNEMKNLNPSERVVWSGGKWIQSNILWVCKSVEYLDELKAFNFEVILEVECEEEAILCDYSGRRKPEFKWNGTPHHEELIVDVTQVILRELSLT